MKHVLLLGGTGAMGVYLSNILLEQKYDVVITTRKHREYREGIHYIVGNAHDLEFLTSVLETRNWDAVIDFMIYGTSEFSKRVELFLNGTKQYVFISSARVFAESDGLITERSSRLSDVSTDTEFLSTDNYACAKARQEDILRASGKMNWTIIRPYITFNENRLQLGVYEKEHWLYRAILGRSIVFSRDIASRYTTMTNGEDVAKGIAGLIGNPVAIGEDFNVTTNETHKWSQILSLYLDVLAQNIGHTPSVYYSDHSVNLRFGYLKYQVKYDRLYDRCFDNTKLMDAVPSLHFGSTMDSLRICLEQFINHHGQFNESGLLFHSILDKVSGEYFPLNKIHGIKRHIGYIMYRYLPWCIIEKIANNFHRLKQFSTQKYSPLRLRYHEKSGC